MEEILSPDSPVDGEKAQSGSTVPLWMTVGVVVLILAILGVGGALVYSVFSRQAQIPMTVADRDITLYEAKVAKNPEDLNARGSLAQAYIAAKRYDEAIREADKMIKLQPKNLGGYYAKGLALRMKGEFKASIAAYDEVLKLMPKEAEAFYQKAVSYRELGDTAAALKSLEGAVDANPLASDIRVELGGMYEAAGQKEKAVQQYKEALKYVPDYAPALAALARLDASGQ